MYTWTWKPGDTLRVCQGRIIERALRYYNGNVTHTAAALGVSLRTMRIRIIEYNLKGLCHSLRNGEGELQTHETQPAPGSLPDLM